MKLPVSGFAALAFLSACSLNPHGPSARIHIQVEGAAEETPFELERALQPGLLSAPTAVSGFSCLGVNVMGPGIADSDLHQGGIAPPPYNPEAGQYCSYGGITSPPIANTAGPKDVNLTVPTGNGRIVQIVGVMQGNTGVCSYSGPLAQYDSGNFGTDDYYELGHAFVDIFQSMSISIPNSYASLTTALQREKRKLNCGNHGVPSPTGKFVNGPCLSTFPPGAPTNGSGTLIPAQYAAMDGTLSYAECTGSAASFKGWAEYEFDTTGIEISAYNYIRVEWKGRAGFYTGACGNSAPAGGGGQIYLYRYVPASWLPLQTVGIAMQTVSTGTGSVSIADYVNGSNKIYVGISGGALPNSADCSTVQTDIILLQLAK